MRNLEKRIEDNKSIVADLKSSWDPSSCRCFVDVFLNRQLKVEVSSLDFPGMAQYCWSADPSGLVSSEIRNRELALPRPKPDQQFDEPVCCGNRHNGSHTPVVFALHGQVSSFSRCRNILTRWSDRRCLVCITLKSLVSLHPDQVQEELTRVVGSRQVRVEDRKNLPFTDAVIHESQRLCNIVPMSIPHKTSRDVTFEGHFIEKVNQNVHCCEMGKGFPETLH